MTMRILLTLIGALMAIAMISSCNEPAPKKEEIALTPENYPNCKTGMFMIIGMNDTSACTKIRNSVMAIPGVYLGEIEFLTQSSWFLFDSTTTTITQIYQTIRTTDGNEYTIGTYESYPGIRENWVKGKEEYYRKDVIIEDYLEK